MAEHAVLNKIKYKDYTFPYNPATTGSKCDRAYVKHKYPDLAGNELEDFGVNAMVITGSGCFFGDDAYDEFNKLYKEFQKNGVGAFYHPIYKSITRGLMVSLESTVESNVNAIKYSFEVIADTVPDVVEHIEKYAVQEIPSNNDDTVKKTYKVGDIVNFNGGTHYVSSYSNAKGYKATAGSAKITLGPDCRGNGKAHPWHLIHTDNKSNVYGWVDEGTFS